MLGLDGLVEVFEAFELRRESAFRGRVHDEDDFAFEVGEGVGLALFCRAADRLVRSFIIARERIGK